MKGKLVDADQIDFKDTIVRDATSGIDGLSRAPKGVNDGNGFIFVSHTGDVLPSGLLPIKVGNVRGMALKDIYRAAPVLKELRNPDLYKGKCGVCEYRVVCGGSRSRAYAITGDYLESVPYCEYIPKELREKKLHYKLIGQGVFFCLIYFIERLICFFLKVKSRYSCAMHVKWNEGETPAGRGGAATARIPFIKKDL